MAYEVFISHSIKDKAVADAVCAKLEEQKIRCWIAPRDIVPGADWAESIIGALGSCKVMILIFSGNANKSHQVRLEVQRAFEKGLTVIPFRIEEVEPAGSLEYYIGSLHWLDALTEPMEHHIENLVTRVESIVGSRSPRTPEAAKTEASSGLKRDKSGQSTPVKTEGRFTSPGDHTIELRGIMISILVVLLAITGGWIFLSKSEKTDASQVKIAQPEKRAQNAEDAARKTQETQVKLAEEQRKRADAEDAARKAQEAQAKLAEEQRKHEEAEDAARKAQEAQAKMTNAVKEDLWENSLGMKFVPVKGTKVLFSIWDTRVKDYKAFVDATKHDAVGGMITSFNHEWSTHGASWKNPGFVQTEIHPVVGVSWKDAKAFCQWLTIKERNAGKIKKSQEYRLPTDEEWSIAVGLPKEKGNTPDEKDSKIEGVYPWGTQWPPPRGSGNYRGVEVRVGNWSSDYGFLEEYRDEYARTSPVGSFLANQFGLYDMGGNVAQWCEDKQIQGWRFRVFRGGSWCDYASKDMLSSRRDCGDPETRNDTLGFRCVLGEISTR